MRLVMDIMHTQIRFEDHEGELRSRIHRLMHTELGVREEGYQFSPAYKSGYWDGIVDFYNPDDDTFPTGLVPKVEEILGRLQEVMSSQGQMFQFEIIDDRPDRFMEVEEMDKEIKLNGDNEPKITLRDYQYESIKSIIDKQTGIINVATGGGKCCSLKTNLLTSNKGYRTFESLFNEFGIDPNQPETTIENTFGIELINRYGQPEKPSHLTINGVRHVNKVKTDRGLEEIITDNHPLLTVSSQGTFVWKEARSLQEGDWVVARKGDNVFGANDKLSAEKAQLVGMLVARRRHNTY